MIALKGRMIWAISLLLTVPLYSAGQLVNNKLLG